MSDIKDTKTITFPIPIKAGDKSYESIDLREPTAGEIDKAQRVSASPAASNIELVALVSGVPARVVQNMRARQFTEAVAFLEGFMGAAPATSET